jgi:hypothetical protein
MADVSRVMLVPTPASRPVSVLSLVLYWDEVWLPWTDCAIQEMPIRFVMAREEIGPSFEIPISAPPKVWRPAESILLNELLLHGCLRAVEVPIEGIESPGGFAERVHQRRLADHLREWERETYRVALREHVAPLLTGPVQVGPRSSDTPGAEGALLTAVTAAFAVDENTTVEKIVRFREEHRTKLLRFRAALFDLGAYMGEATSAAEPARSFAVARDVVRHRVEPALSSLESALKESGVKFVVKSLVGAASVTLGPITPATAVSGSLALGAQTIDYAFARSTLREEHPYAYLHEARVNLGVADTDRFMPSREPRTWEDTMVAEDAWSV